MKTGDVIEKVTTAAGIRPCEKCKKRKELINRYHDAVVQKIRTIELGKMFKR